MVRTAKSSELRAHDWKANGAGRNVSHSFGYGLLDASAMVRLAREWENVPEQRRCQISYPSRYDVVPNDNRLYFELYTDGCAEQSESKVNYLEHVQSIITLKSQKRGAMQIYLTSPEGEYKRILKE